VGAKACLQGSDRWEWISHWLPTSGQQWAAWVACCADKQTRLDCTLLLCQEPGYEEAWAVVTDLPPQQIHGAWYRFRKSPQEYLAVLDEKLPSSPSSEGSDWPKGLYYR